MDLALVKESIGNLRTGVNNYFSGKDAFYICVATTGVSVTAVYLVQAIKNRENIHDRLKVKFFKLLRRIPAIGNKIEGELLTIKQSFYTDMDKRMKGVGYITRLPEKPISDEAIAKEVATYLDLGEYDWESGYVSGAVYYHEKSLCDLVARVHGLASYTNPLHPDVFPGVCKMEGEIVKISCNLFNGTKNACGCMTSGGTESILMAMKAYRDFARDTKDITEPEAVLPMTAHPAFNKASQYFGIRLRFVPVDPKTYIVDPKKMAKYITSNTIVLIASAPNYPYGTMDPIPQIAAIGLKRNIPVHVDSCLGGFLVPFMAKAGYPLEHGFDFSVPGVTSISADTHKYGFTPKGSSVIMYSESKYLHSQFSTATDWPGGVYGSPTVSGSRAGGNIAACWATLLRFGMEGYIDATKKIIETARRIEKEVREMEGVFVFGKPATSVVAIGSDTFHIYHLLDALGKKGWNLNPLQSPPGLHIGVTHMLTRPGVADRFLNDVKEIVAHLLKNPPASLEGKMALYGTAASLPDRSIVSDFTRLFLESLLFTDSSKPHNFLTNESNGVKNPTFSAQQN
ncbi:sphingosine-1-phosphate lyase isoform X2 [Neocloeon triangulifer]|uniref:sphingosine-1-phosphate lyase isoform X2 n=1 Tax=Neocloeon triangulifer TaxID=2078957 RepID=UPI00286F1235|nr:sphingosine-1-phosphate lyase isoform X2 [Neocloeon triangulifer]